MTMIIDPYALGLNVVRIDENEAVCHCPFNELHPNGDIHPSASLNIVTGKFFCFSCTSKASAKSLAKRLDGKVRMIPLANLKVINQESRKPEEEWRHYLESPPAYGNKYLHSRAFNDRWIKKFDVRENEAGVIFPLVNLNMATVGVVVRFYSGRFRYRSFGDKKVPWGLHQKLDVNKPLWVVEGPFGAIRAIRTGLQAVALSGVYAKKDITEFLSAFDLRILFDDDSAGYRGASRLLKQVPRAKVVIPGMEADELSKDEWKALSTLRLPNVLPSSLARLADAKAKIVTPRASPLYTAQL